MSDTPPRPPAHHRSGGGFRNPWPGSEPQGFSGVLRWMLYERAVHPRRADPPPDSFARVPPAFVAPRADAGAVTVTWVGHSTVLVQVGGANVLTDPMWGERASPLPFAGPRRWVPPAVAFDALPPIDVVLISHNHYDHLDDGTVRRLAAREPRACWFAPLGVGSFLRERGARDVRELDWWQEGALGALRLTCAPAQHFSARGLGDRDRTLWGSWSVHAPAHAVFFGGDSGYHPDFATIARRCGPFDVTLLPIGAYEPRWFMRPVHMDADEAVRAFLDMRSAQGESRRMVMVPVHWGTFKLTDEPMDEPPRRVGEAWARAGLRTEDLWLLRHGETRAL